MKDHKQTNRETRMKNLITNLFWITILLSTSTKSFCQNDAKTGSVPAGVDLLRRVHQRYFHGPCKIYAFSQKNTHYRNDSITGHSEWHEVIAFPDRFRINFGDQNAGNFVVYRNDSAFNYQSGKLVKKRKDTNVLLLLLGGMFYREFEEVTQRLEQGGYDLNRFSEQSWKGKNVYVVGAMLNDLESNQLWIDKETWRVLRIIEKIKDKDMMDMRFESHQLWCKGYVETRVSFRRNGKLEQVEEYFNIRETDRFPTE